MPDSEIKLLYTFKSFYEKAELLNDFLGHVNKLDIKTILENASNEYQNILLSTIICREKNHKSLTDNINFTQFSEQKEIVNDVSYKILRKNADNLLTAGYLYKVKISEKIDFSNISNQQTEIFCQNFWKWLLSKIGNEIMEYILYHTSVFIPLKNSCYMQISGQPFNEYIKINEVHLNYMKTNKKNFNSKINCYNLFKNIKSNSEIKNKKSEINKKLQLFSSFKFKKNDLQKFSICSNQANINGSQFTNDKASTSSEPKRKKLKIDGENLNGIKKKSNNPITQNDSFLKSIHTTNQENFSSEKDTMTHIKKFKDSGFNSNFDINKNLLNEKEFCIYHSFSNEKYNKNENSILNINHVSKFNCLFNKVNSKIINKNQKLKYSNINTILLDKNNCNKLFAPLSTVNVYDNNYYTMSNYTKMKSFSPVKNLDQNTVPCKTNFKFSNNPAAVENIEEIEKVKYILTDNYIPSGKTNIKKKQIFIKKKLNTKLVHRKSKKLFLCNKKNIKNMSTLKNKNMFPENKMSSLTNVDSSYSEIIVENISFSKTSKDSELEKEEFKAFNETKLINRGKMFYSKILIERFPPKIGYVNPKLNIESANQLFEEIFKQNNEIYSVEAKKNLLLNYDLIREEIRNILFIMLKNHLKCRYKYILNHHTYLASRKPVDLNQLNPEEAAIELKNGMQYFIERHVHCEQMYSFLKSCIMNVIPVELIGGDKNRQLVLINVKKFIFLNRFESLSIGQVMFKIKASKFSWLSKIKLNSLKLSFISKLYYWIFNNFLINLISSYFYATEKSNHGGIVFYYRKYIWKSINNLAIFKFTYNETFVRIAENEVIEMIKNKKSLGVINARVLPKHDSFRLIVNTNKTLSRMNSGLKSSIYSDISIYKHIENLQKVLKFERNVRIQMIPNNIQSSLDIYTKWKAYIQLNKQRINDNQKFYFLKYDIKECYDSLNHPLLFKIISKILQNKEYTILQYTKCIPINNDKPKIYYIKDACLDNQIPDFQEYANSLIESKKINSVLFINRNRILKVDYKQLLVDLYHVIFGCIIKFNNSFYKRKKGINHGCLLSSILADLYYSDMEFKIFPKLKSDELLIRQADDYLFITPYEKNISKLLHLATKGIEKYNLFINLDKSITNLKLANHLSSNIKYCQNNQLLYCGYLINTNTLEITPNFPDNLLYYYQFGNVNPLKNPGLNLLSKLKQVISNKCKAIYLDPSINKFPTILRTVDNVGKLVAYRLLYCTNKILNDNSFTTHAKFIASVVWKASNFVRFYLNKFGEPEELNIYLEKIKLNPKNELRKNCWVNFIFLKSFIEVLKEHTKKFKILIILLSSSVDRLRSLLGIECYKFLISILI